jgi:hypothetical protein
MAKLKCLGGFGWFAVSFLGLIGVTLALLDLFSIGNFSSEI